MSRSRSEDTMSFASLGALTTLSPSMVATPHNIQSRRELRRLGTTPAKMPPSLERLSADQSGLFQFVHMVNELYQTHLKKQPPFVRFILIGLQSTGKSTVVERLIKFPMNIVAEGTGTRCPLYVTCINDPKSTEPLCEITGCKLCPRDEVSHREVFTIVTKHNREHVDGAFSPSPLRLSVRSASVENLIFVDLPGIIVTKGQGEDTREGIKAILRQEMSIPNTKLLVLLEPKEYATNSIIDFVDDTLGSRDEWLARAIFMMTKFDLRTADSQTGSKSNRFLDEFWENGVKPYMAITPTLQCAADTFATPEEQYAERQRLLDAADAYEKDKFDAWQAQMALNYQENPRNERFGTSDRPYAESVGFGIATKQMFKCILNDTAQRLPDVIKDITCQLHRAEEELTLLKAAEQFVDVKHVQSSVAKVLHNLVKIINEYLTGSLRIAKKMQEEHQTLADEIFSEEESDWCNRSLNHLSTEEDEWRQHVAKMVDHNTLPEHVQPHEKYLGGKQFQRAILLFKAVMMDRIPTPHELESFVPSVTCALRDGAMMESWEHATVGVINECVRGVTQAGINYFVKHAMVIFQRLIRVALLDAKVGEECSSLLYMMPPYIEDFLIKKYDEMIWDLGMKAAESCHHAIKPYYSTGDPSQHAKSAVTVPLKAHWALYKEVLVHNHIGPLYHFTDKRNLASIARFGGLVSRATLQSRGVTFYSGSDDKTVKFHEALGLDKYVHVSFGREAASCFSAQKKNRIGDCALLEIDPSIVTWRETKFGDASLQMKGYHIGETLDDLKRVRFEDATQTRGSSRFGTNYHHAAVFVFERIPIEYIKIHENALPKKATFWEKQMVRNAARKPVKETQLHTAEPPKFLVASRCQIVDENEVSRIFDKAYEHIIRLCDLIVPCLDFQFNHYLFQGFQEKLQNELGFTLAASPELAELAPEDAATIERCAELRNQVEKLNEALLAVQRLQQGRF